MLTRFRQTGWAIGLSYQPYDLAAAQEQMLAGSAGGDCGRLTSRRGDRSELPGPKRVTGVEVAGLDSRDRGRADLADALAVLFVNLLPLGLTRLLRQDECLGAE